MSCLSFGCFLSSVSQLKGLIGINCFDPKYVNQSFFLWYQYVMCKVSSYGFVLHVPSLMLIAMMRA